MTPYDIYNDSGMWKGKIYNRFYLCWKNMSKQNWLTSR